eukprot:Anaeramoba_ignava/a489518_8.p2 GENE.a489518_8~~a489518_8.p2  ORF type:complete len:163 (-),score=58.93 a489518_8:757-1245(-)
MNQNSNSNHFNFSLFTLPERKKGNQNPKQEMKTKRRIKKETPQPFKGIDIRNFIPNFETKKKQLESLDDVIFEFKNLLNEKTEEEKEEDKPIQEIDDSMFFLRPFEDYYALNFGITLNPQIRIFSVSFFFQQNMKWKKKNWIKQCDENDYKQDFEKRNDCWS